MTAKRTLLSQLSAGTSIIILGLMAAWAGIALSTPHAVRFILYLTGFALATVPFALCIRSCLFHDVLDRFTVSQTVVAIGSFALAIGIIRLLPESTRSDPDLFSLDTAVVALILCGIPTVLLFSHSWLFAFKLRKPE